MTYRATVVNVLIASPGDVGIERRRATEIVHEWNAIHAQTTGIVLMPVTWEQNAAPAMGDRAQGIINGQLLDAADLLVGIFWTRAGTPTGTARSGTIEEIERHLAADRPAMLYFSSVPVAPSISIQNSTMPFEAFEPR